MCHQKQGYFSINGRRIITFVSIYLLVCTKNYFALACTYKQSPANGLPDVSALQYDDSCAINATTWFPEIPKASKMLAVFLHFESNIFYYASFHIVNIT
jgi:hypothetical protein